MSAFIRPELAGNEEMRRIIIARYGLDQPLPIRYIHWLAEALQGNLGYKLQGGAACRSSTRSRRGLRASLLLMGTALLIGIFVGIPLGVLSALRQYSKTDYALTGIAFLGISMPSFMLGTRRALYLFGLTFRIFPIGGMVTAGAPFSVPDLLSHLALPAIILGVGYVAILMRYTRSSMLEVLGSLYVTTASPRVSRHGSSSCATRSGAPSSRSSRSSGCRCRSWSAARSSSRRCSAGRASAA